MLESINVRRFLKARSARVALQKALQEAQAVETAAYGKLKGAQLTQAQQHIATNPYESSVRVRTMDAQALKK